MGAMSHQLGVKAEVTYGTAVVVDRFFEYDSESIEDSFNRTEGDPLRVGSSDIRSDRSTPWYGGASGNVSMAVLTKGFGFWMPHMLGGAVVTTGPVDSKYTHTFGHGELFGKSFTAQFNRPFHPSGTDQPFTFEGGKVTEWTLSNSVDDNLMLELGLDFEQVSTATGLASASYPASMDNFTWAGGAVTVGGVAFDITEFSLKRDNGQDTERQQIRGNTDKKEPTSSRRSGEFSLKADFDSLTQRTRAASAVRATTHAAIVATWTGPVLIGAASYPTFTVTIPAARFDTWKGATEGTDAIEQELSGVVRYDGTNSPITIAVGSSEATP